MEELKKVRDLQKFVASELIFIYGAEGFRNLYKNKKKKHLHSMAADVYAVGWIAKKFEMKTGTRSILRHKKRNNL